MATQRRIQHKSYIQFATISSSGAIIGHLITDLLSFTTPSTFGVTFSNYVPLPRLSIRHHRFFAASTTSSILQFTYSMVTVSAAGLSVSHITKSLVKLGWVLRAWSRSSLDHLGDGWMGKHNGHVTSQFKHTVWPKIDCDRL